EIVSELLENSHYQYSNKVYNDENTIQTSIINTYIFARVYYTIIPEVDSGKGYTDIFFIPLYNDKPAMIVELKYNKTTNTDIKQIKNWNYPAILQHYKDNLLLISINYDNEAKNYIKNLSIIHVKLRSTMKIIMKSKINEN
ncbi:hypothetical protein U3516DRAFT_549493, partial [Neocallimastix sp. 'constans']